MHLCIGVAGADGGSRLHLSNQAAGIRVVAIDGSRIEALAEGAAQCIAHQAASGIAASNIAVYNTQVFDGGMVCRGTEETYSVVCLVDDNTANHVKTTVQRAVEGVARRTDGRPIGFAAVERAVVGTHVAMVYDDVGYQLEAGAFSHVVDFVIGLAFSRIGRVGGVEVENPACVDALCQ